MYVVYVEGWWAHVQTKYEVSIFIHFLALKAGLNHPEWFVWSNSPWSTLFQLIGNPHGLIKYDCCFTKIKKYVLSSLKFLHVDIQSSFSFKYIYFNVGSSTCMEMTMYIVRHIFPGRQRIYYYHYVKLYCSFVWFVKEYAYIQFTVFDVEYTFNSLSLT